MAESEKLILELDGLGDPSAGLHEQAGSLEALLELAARDEHEGP